MGGDTAQNPAMQQLQAQQQRQALAKAIQTGIQGIGTAVGQPTPMPLLGGGRPGAAAYPAAAAAAPTTGVGAALGPLFRPTGAGGIDEQQLAMILKQLGYA